MWARCAVTLVEPPGQRELAQTLLPSSDVFHQLAGPKSKVGNPHEDSTRPSIHPSIPSVAFAIHDHYQPPLSRRFLLWLPSSSSLILTRPSTLAAPLNSSILANGLHSRILSHANPPDRDRKRHCDLAIHTQIHQ